MDEFTNIAIWLLIIYLAINASIIWFAGSDTFLDNGLGIQGIEANTAFQEQELIIFRNTFFETNCSTASSNLFSYVPCFLAQVSSYFGEIAGQIWNLLTAWSNLIGAIFPQNTALGSLGQFIQNIIGPIFGGIAFMGFFVILLRVAGIIRGGS